MPNFWQTITIGILSGGLSAAIVGAFLGHFLNKRLDKESRQRIEAAKVAESFARWAKYAGKEDSILDKKDLYNYYEDLTKMSYELSLWIKNEKLVKEIMKRFVNSEDALSTKELIIKVRELILNKKSKKLTANDLVHWCVKDG
jgi:hypothetical protein